MPPIRSAAFATAALLACLALSACAQPQSRDGRGDGDASASASTSDSASASATASISGVIMHPGHVVPAMRICALSDKTVASPAPDVCIQTRAGADRYTLAGLRAGTYQIVAKVNDGTAEVGGHVRPVQCIRAPCPDMLAEVTVAAGEQRDGIHLDGFSPERADFPALP